MREEVSFQSAGITCRGFLYRPAGKGRAPCIVMAHGFGATRDAGLEPYAQSFAAAGYAVLVFDYRFFGASDGEPRQVLSVSAQHADFRSALSFARTLEAVDAERIVLWGSSFSGGHVVEVAVQDGRVAAVVSQCPMMDGLLASLAVVQTHGLRYGLRLQAHGYRDLLGSWFGRAPHTIPIVAPPGQLAAMAAPDADPGYRAIMPQGFNNTVAARITILLARYRPVLKAHKLRCPVLFQICETDSVAPAKAAERAVRAAGAHAEVKRYPIGHFDVYRGEHFERGVRDQIAFLERHVPVPREQSAIYA